MALSVAGCAAPSVAPPATKAVARLRIVNLTDYAWTIGLTPAGAPQPRRQAVGPRAEVAMELPPGECVIEQTVTGATAAPGATRRLTVRFEGGEEYRWPLATLLSGLGEDSLAESGGGAR